MASLLRPNGRGCLAFLLGVLVPFPAGANLLANGSFETGPPPGDATQLAVGSTAITGWVVTRTNIDYCGTRWTAAQGACSLGLNGTSPGGIAQAITTLPRAIYTVRFYMAGDPLTTPSIKTMRVAAAGQSADFTADITGMWAWDPGWNPHVWSFTANSTSTTIEFYSLDSGDAGPALDSVTVELTSTAGVGSGTPGTLVLSPVAPDPTHDGGRFQFSLPREEFARVRVVDLAGREVALLAEGALAAGPHEAAWNGRTARGLAASGVYFIELSATEKRLVRRFVLLQ